MLRGMFSHTNLQYRKIEITELIDVLRHVCKLSFVSRSDRHSSWEFNQSLSYLAELHLHEHITFVSRNYRDLPINSERHLYDMYNIVIRDLHIVLNDRTGWSAHEDWWPLCYAKWHFEKCNFEVPSSGSMWSIIFPWPGSFRFYRNQFNFQPDRFGGSWMFAFREQSIVLFQENNFMGHNIQTRCAPRRQAQNTPIESSHELRQAGSISFIGNRCISDLGILEGYSSISLTGMNQIEHLWLLTLLETPFLTDDMTSQRPVFYFGPREKIDPHFHYCLRHRQMFIHLRRLAAMTQDSTQISVLDKQIDRIQYHLNKEQRSPSPLEVRIWSEYWQDRLLYAYRRWSSDFYKSWLRPLLSLLLGYVALNAAPWFLIEDFTLSHWIQFTLRPISEIADYEGSLSTIFVPQYAEMSPSDKNWLRLIGHFELIWIAMCSFAFARAIKR